MTDFLALAERCERATGPDKRLGAEVEIAICGFPERAYQQRNALRPHGAPPLDRLEWAASEWFGSGPTASLDAAMTLVPENWTRDIQDADNGDCICCLDYEGSMDDEANPDRQAWARAKTWPLAITAAALKARAITHSPESGLEREGE